jgi:D-aminoacyl-tRNA deacylase
MNSSPYIHIVDDNLIQHIVVFCIIIDTDRFHGIEHWKNKISQLLLKRLLTYWISCFSLFCYPTRLKLQLLVDPSKLNHRYILVASTNDLAGATMTRYLMKRAEFARGGDRHIEGESYCSPRYKNIELYVSSGSLLTLENLDDIYSNADVFIFLSKHRSDSRIPTLTCHFTGNFSADNSYGGNPRQIAVSYPSLQKGYLKAITAIRQIVPEYDITIEATHHGPTSLCKPVLFVELGSSDKQWADENAAAAICDALLGILSHGFETCDKVGLAFGGTHYPSKFNKLLLESEFGLAAVVSKHNLAALDDVIFDQMLEKSIEKVTHVIVDNKGLGNQKERITKLAERSHLQVHRI